MSREEEKSFGGMQWDYRDVWTDRQAEAIGDLVAGAWALLMVAAVFAVIGFIVMDTIAGVRERRRARNPEPEPEG